MNENILILLNILYRFYQDLAGNILLFLREKL